MCGILGYVGEHEAAPILLKGLKRLEYRGYDSAGLAVLSPEGEVNIMKAKGRLSESPLTSMPTPSTAMTSAS